MRNVYCLLQDSHYLLTFEYLTFIGKRMKSDKREVRKLFGGDENSFSKE